MRAISVRQPWAELIARGTKDIEYRTWSVSFRGDLMIVASASRHDDDCAAEGVNPDSVVYGATVCVVELVEVTGTDGDYQWHLKNPRRVEPLRQRGYAAIYRVDSDSIRFADGSRPSVDQATIARPRAAKTRDVDLADTVSQIKRTEDSELRRRVFDIGGEGPDPGPAYLHQVEALRRIEIGAAEVPPVSGILHFPTGAGKTRVGVEMIARALKADGSHRFIWATHTKNLIRQTMVRMAELSRLFPPQTTFAWARDADDAADPEQDVHVLFMTRSALTDAFDRAVDRRRKHPWRMRLQDGRAMTLIYDECHQLGAEKLQETMRQFYEDLVLAPRATPTRWRTLGLSATPVPTQFKAHKLLEEHIFPRRDEVQSAGGTWPFHVLHRVQNETLVTDGVLCPANLYFDQTGEFDLPPRLLKQIIGDAHLRPPGANADKMRVQQYAMQFNKRVLADARVLEFLADRIGKNIALLGKTIVFVPNIDAANRFAGILYERFPDLRGNVAAVHSRMDELEVPGQGPATVHEVLERFRQHGDQPSVLVNVDMLTEGFDDPKIRTVVLARLTLSTNRFWQMIGRGTRGPAARGTADCNVIDPVKLTRVYDYFGGYQPKFSEDEDKEFEDLDEQDPGQDALPPQIPSVVRPPDPGLGGYEVDPELDRVHAQVAVALRHFLTGHALSEQQAVAAARSVCVALDGGKAVLRPSAAQGFDPTSATAILLGEISRVEEGAGVDLGWFRRQLPSNLDETLLRQRMRLLRAVESLALWTEPAFAAAQMSGALLSVLQVEASGSALQTGAPSAVPTAPRVPSVPPLSNAEAMVLEAGLAVAAADGEIVDAEIAVILETLRRMFGRAPTSELEARVRAHPKPTALSVEKIEAVLTPGERQRLLLHLAEVAAADAIVTKEERDMLDVFASRLGVPPAFVDALLGDHLGRAKVAPVTALASSCPGCASRTPVGAAFCPSCGTGLRSVASEADGVRTQGSARGGHEAE